MFEQNNIFEIILHVHSPLKISSEYHCGSHKVYLLFWVRKLVAVTVYKQVPTPSALGGIAHHRYYAQLAQLVTVLLYSY